MKRMTLGLAVVAATTALLVVSASTDAAGRGRAASQQGLGEAMITGKGDVIPSESISLNFVKAINPDTPGVTPGGSNPEP
jgi:hypothetical protein